MRLMRSVRRMVFSTEVYSIQFDAYHKRLLVLLLPHGSILVGKLIKTNEPITTQQQVKKQHDHQSRN